MTGPDMPRVGPVLGDQTVGVPCDGVEDSRERLSWLRARRPELVATHGEDGYAEILQNAQQQLERALDRERN